MTTSPQCADFADLASTSAEPAACFRDEASHGGVNMTSRSIANVIDPRPNPETCARLPRGVEASAGAARLSSRHAPPAAAAAPSTPPSAAIAPLASSSLVQAAWSKRGLRGARAAWWAKAGKRRGRAPVRHQRPPPRPWLPSPSQRDAASERGTCLRLWTRRVGGAQRAGGLYARAQSQATSVAKRTVMPRVRDLAFAWHLF